MFAADFSSKVRGLFPEGLAVRVILFSYEMKWRMVTMGVGLDW